MKTIVPMALESSMTEEEIEELADFLVPGYSVVDDAMNRLKESDPKGFTVGEYFNDAHDCAAHLMAHLLDDEETFYHRFCDMQDEFGFRDPELLNSALNFLIRLGIIRLDVSVRGGKELTWFVVHADYRHK